MCARQLDDFAQKVGEVRSNIATQSFPSLDKHLTSLASLQTRFLTIHEYCHALANKCTIYANSVINARTQLAVLATTMITLEAITFGLDSPLVAAATREVMPPVITEEIGVATSIAEINAAEAANITTTTTTGIIRGTSNTDASIVERSELAGDTGETAATVDSQIGELESIAEAEAQQAETIGEKISSNDHTWEKHRLEKPEWATREGFKKDIIDTVLHGEKRELTTGQTYYYSDETEMIVQSDPYHSEGGTAFKPHEIDPYKPAAPRWTTRRGYFDHITKGRY